MTDVASDAVFCASLASERERGAEVVSAPDGSDPLTLSIDEERREEREIALSGEEQHGLVRLGLPCFNRPPLNFMISAPSCLPSFFSLSCDRSFQTTGRLKIVLLVVHACTYVDVHTEETKEFGQRIVEHII